MDFRLGFIKSKKNRKTALEISDFIASTILDIAKKFYKNQSVSSFNHISSFCQPDISITYDLSERNETLIVVKITVCKSNTEDQCIFGYNGIIELGKNNKLYISKFVSINDVVPTDEIYTFLENL